MFRTNVRDPPIPKVDDTIFFRRDGDGWLVPTTVTEVYSYVIKLLHNGHIKPSRMNQLRSVQQVQSSTPTSDGPITEILRHQLLIYDYDDEDNDDCYFNDTTII